MPNAPTPTRASLADFAIRFAARLPGRLVTRPGSVKENSATDQVYFADISRLAGYPISGILYKPESLKPGIGAPAVLWIHGGPESEDVFRFDPWAQYRSQQGYLVLEPNYRGSTGYGEKFRNLSVGDSGGGEADDVAAGAQYLVDQGLADPKRLGIGGGLSSLQSL